MRVLDASVRRTCLRRISTAPKCMPCSGPRGPLGVDWPPRRMPCACWTVAIERPSGILVDALLEVGERVRISEPDRAEVSTRSDPEPAQMATPRRSCHGRSGPLVRSWPP